MEMDTISNPAANPAQLSSMLSALSDQQLQQFAMAHQDNAAIVGFVLAEKQRRQRMQTSQQGMAPQAPPVNQQVIAGMAPPQPQLPEDQGIGTLPAPNMQGMAGGGIVAFAGGGAAGADFFDQALRLEGVTDPKEIAFLRAIHNQESGGKSASATSNRGAVGPMQILPATFESVADPDMDIDSPLDSARAGIRYARQGLAAAGGDPGLAATYYYGGPNGMKMAAQGKFLRDPKNPGNPSTLEYAQSVLKKMGAGVEALISSARAAEPARVSDIPTAGYPPAPPSTGPSWWSQLFASPEPGQVEKGWAAARAENAPSAAPPEKAPTSSLQSLLQGSWLGQRAPGAPEPGVVEKNWQKLREESRGQPSTEPAPDNSLQKAIQGTWLGKTVEENLASARDTAAGLPGLFKESAKAPPAVTPGDYAAKERGQMDEKAAGIAALAPPATETAAPAAEDPMAAYQAILDRVKGRDFDSDGNQTIRDYIAELKGRKKSDERDALLAAAAGMLGNTSQYGSVGLGKGLEGYLASKNASTRSGDEGQRYIMQDQSLMARAQAAEAASLYATAQRAKEAAQTLQWRQSAGARDAQMVDLVALRKQYNDAALLDPVAKAMGFEAWAQSEIPRQLALQYRTQMGGRLPAAGTGNGASNLAQPGPNDVILQPRQT